MYMADKKRKKIVRPLLCILSAAVVAAGIFTANMFGLFHAGNRGEYSVKNMQPETNSPLQGKTVLFLGSSVTYGYASMGESFADYLAATDGIICRKEAVSGTTLADLSGNSYVSRLQKTESSVRPDVFVCQLSTNDATKNIPLGSISDTTDAASFDTSTVAGAIEFIISYVRQTWDCPVVFYTQAKYDSAAYADMVDLLATIAAKWDITVLDLWNNEEVNAITQEQRELYLVDTIHPTKAGYAQWWLPHFRSCLIEVLQEA